MALIPYRGWRSYCEIPSSNLALPKYCLNGHLYLYPSRYISNIHKKWKIESNLKAITSLLWFLPSSAVHEPDKHCNRDGWISCPFPILKSKFYPSSFWEHQWGSPSCCCYAIQSWKFLKLKHLKTFFKKKADGFPKYYGRTFFSTLLLSCFQNTRLLSILCLLCPFQVSRVNQ